MRKLLSLVLAMAILCGVSSALADPIRIDGTSERNITINDTGLNKDPQALIDEDGISPTTGRYLDDIEWKEGWDAGVAPTKEGTYRPIMVQISNAGNGVGISSSGKLYGTAPINASYADIVYEAPQKKGGSETRMSMIFSDVIPDYVGFVRSTRLTHVYLRQEWDCAFCTSGYSTADVPDGWRRTGTKSPQTAVPGDPGLVYVGDFPREVWTNYVWRLSGKTDANSEIFMLSEIWKNTVPQDHKAANHTFRFTDTLPEGGDDAEIIYVTFGSKDETNSRLEYEEDKSAYVRYVSIGKTGDQPYMDTVLVNPVLKKVRTSEGEMVTKIVAEDRVLQNVMTFNNVIVQSVKFNWNDSLRPDPVLVGTGNADYFMGGRHYAGVWKKDEGAARTVFYDANGNELELQRGRTLIILMDYNQSINNGKDKANVQYE